MALAEEKIQEDSSDNEAEGSPSARRKSPAAADNDWNEAFHAEDFFIFALEDESSPDFRRKPISEEGRCSDSDASSPFVLRYHLSISPKTSGVRSASSSKRVHRELQVMSSEWFSS